ncbi:hypothetical protein HaLaN_27230 [Haematococcus lacustris]|uniref:Uncharacterized protein n=1 Tax=Haematococcus lacustris TaxID=44745 RepID=A0A6A0A958_HAELA|nr:hypothetical protein HaLaN_27230 [Haematococcus lacustris]
MKFAGFGKQLSDSQQHQAPHRGVAASGVHFHAQGARCLGKSCTTFRTEAHQQAVFGRLADASLTATARSQLSQDESTQPIASGLWGWAGLPGGAKPLLVRQHGGLGAGRLLAELNRRSAEVPRANDFQIPCPGSYFTGKGECVPLHHFTPWPALE